MNESFPCFLPRLLIKTRTGGLDGRKTWNFVTKYSNADAGRTKSSRNALILSTFALMLITKPMFRLFSDKFMAFQLRFYKKNSIDVERNSEKREFEPSIERKCSPSRGVPCRNSFHIANKSNIPSHSSACSVPKYPTKNTKIPFVMTLQLLMFDFDFRCD